MTDVRRPLRNAALMLAGILGQFGNDVRPRTMESGPQVQGYRGGKNGRNPTQIARSKRSRHRVGHGKIMHRRSFVFGKPATRNI